MKKGSVEFLINELPKHGSGAVKTFGDLFEQAKAMEDERIIKAIKMARDIKYINYSEEEIINALKSE